MTNILRVLLISKAVGMTTKVNQCVTRYEASQNIALFVDDKSVLAISLLFNGKLFTQEQDNEIETCRVFVTL